MFTLQRAEVVAIENAPSRGSTQRARRAVPMLVGAIGLLIALAPVAHAGPTCKSAGSTTICETNGSINIKTEPGTTAPPASQPAYPWLIWG